mgnify:FL=1
MLLNNHFSNLNLLLDNKYYSQFNSYNKINDDSEIQLPSNLDFRFSYTVPENSKQNKVNNSFISTRLKNRFIRRYRYIYKFFYRKNILLNRRLLRNKKKLFSIHIL